MCLFKLGQYFFEENDFDINDDIQGETRRTRSGKIKSDVSSVPYKEFRLEIDRVKPEQHGQLLYLVNLMLPIDNVAINQPFVSPHGNDYEVTIPVDGGYDYTPLRGVNQRYEWVLNLWEVID